MRLFAAGAVAGAAVAAAAPAAGPPPSCAVAGWPQPRQSACSTASANDGAAPSAANAGGVRLAWSARLAAPAGNPVVSGSRVYLATGARRPRLDARDLATGRYLWSAISGAPGGLTPLVDGNVLLRLSPQNVLRRYEPTRGRIFWRRAIPALPEGPANQQVAAGGVWYESEGEQLAAYDDRRGTPLWTLTLQCFRCTVAVAGGRVYAAGSPSGTGAGALYALDARSGRTIWSTRGANGMTTVSSPLLENGMLLVVTTQSAPTWTFFVEAFRASDGKPLWQTRLGSAGGFDPATAAAAGAGIVVYPLPDGFLYALDIRTGALRWRVPVGETDSSPAIANGVVWLVDGANRLTAFDAASGRTLWSAAPADGLEAASPVVAGRFVLVGTPDGRLLAYAAT